MAKYYAIIMSDEPAQAAIMEASNQREAIAAGNYYIRAWGNDARVLKVKALKGTTPEERRQEANNFAEIYFNEEGWRYY